MTLLRRMPNSYSGMIKDYLFTLVFNNRNDRCVRLFEQKYAKYLHVPDVVCTSSGCHSLGLALDFYKINKNKKVILPAYTAKVVQDVLKEKGIPYISIDIDPLTANISFEKLKQAPLDQCSAIIITHLFGRVVEKEVVEYCRKANLLVIEDCAHAHGARFSDGDSVGTCGDVGFYSFGYSKIINTYTGGLLIAKSPEILKYARDDLKNHKRPRFLTMLCRAIFGNFEHILSVILWIPFIKYFLYSESLLSNFKEKINKASYPDVTQYFKYTNAQAILGIKQLDYLAENLEQRKKICEYYEKNFSKALFLKKRSGDVCYNQILLLKKASSLRRKFLQANIDVGTGASIMKKMDNCISCEGVDRALFEYIQLPFGRHIDQKEIEAIRDKTSAFI